MAPPQSYAEVGWLSYISFSWLNPLMTTGEQRQVMLEDMPQLASEEDTCSRTREFLRVLDEEERRRHSHPLLRAIMRAYWPQLLLMEVLGIVQHLMALAAPLLLKQVLVFQEAQHVHGKLHGNSPAAFGAVPLSQGQVVTGLCAIAGSILLGLVTLVFASQVTFYKDRLNIRMGQALRGAILTRCVQGELPQITPSCSSNSARKTAPAVYNVISFDVQPNIDIIWIILAAWLFPFQFITALAVLFQQVRWAILPGLAVILVAEAICGVLYYYDGNFRHALLAAKDDRLGCCDEAFNNIRTLQMLSWTGRFEKQILDARNEELRIKNMRLWLTKMVAALSYVLGAAVTLVTLAYFVTYYSHGALKASVAVPVIGLVTGLIGPFAQLPTWLNQYMVWRSAYSRVNQYMGLCPDAGSIISEIGGSAGGGGPEGGAARLLASRLDGNCWEVSQSMLEDSTNCTGTAVAGFKDCTLSWGAGLEVARGGSKDGNGCVVGHASRDDNEDGPTVADFCDVEAGAMAVPLLGSSEADATLQNLDLEVAAGEVLVLVGQEGQGKSSVLSALLGEMPLVSGAVFSPAIARRASEASKPLPLPETAQASRDLLEADLEGQGFGPTTANAVAFAPQEAAIYTGTIRWNILFGCRHDPALYEQVLSACQLQPDIATMALGDLSEVSQGGATLSGGQKARVSLARAVYRAALDLKEDLGQCSSPLVLLDEPFCALDRAVAREIACNLFHPVQGLLARAAVLISTVDPWWLPVVSGQCNANLHNHGHQSDSIRIAVLREGRLVTIGRMAELRNLCAEFPELKPAFQTAEGRTTINVDKNPQDDSDGLESTSADGDISDNASMDRPHCAVTKVLKKFDEPLKMQAIVHADPSKVQLATCGKLLQEERREQGHVKSATYSAYLGNVGHYTVGATLCAICGIMLFQELTTLWISYWSADSRESHFMHAYVLRVFGTIPSGSHWLLWVYAGLLAFFAFNTFAGHALEIIGGMRAARVFFKEALEGTLGRPFRWWDSNPTGRVLNRFSEDVEVMDNAITNIIGVITGAILYFAGHVFILALANKFSLALLPIIAILFECIARYYRKTIREVHRLYLVSMSTLYQGMVEAIVGSTTVRAFAASQRVVCQSLDSLDVFMRISFTKACINSWVGLRMGLVGYSLAVATTLYPVLQYFGFLAPQSAVLVGFSITYSTGISTIIQQFIMNFSDLEMQLISIERLREYARGSPPPLVANGTSGLFHAPGLELRNVSVTYADGLKPALEGVSLMFAPGESYAIVGRTGAGKSSMMLSILQLVPYTGHIAIDGQVLSRLNSKDVCQRLVGVVPQHPVIFNGSVRWNLDPDGQKGSMELWRALEAVGLRKVLLADGRGLEAPLGSVPGATSLPLSQGQRQLLCAARALLRQPRVVLLDEVSACLPATVAKTVVASLLARFTEEDATVLLVTHQAEITAACDHVITVAGGHIVGNAAAAMAVQ